MTDRSGTWSGEPVLVTGAGGFIGSHLVEALVAAGADVRALVHYNARGDWGNLEYLDADAQDSLDVVLGDVQDPFAVRNAVRGREVVFHLAALIGIPYSYVAPQSYVATNIVGTLNVLEAARSEGCRVVHTSTSETYGSALYTPIDEDHPLQGQSPYSASKIAADKMTEAYVRSFDVRAATLRPFNTYGPRQSLRAVIPTIAAQALTGSVVHLGSLAPVRDLTFVTDTVEAFLALGASEEALGRTLNVGSGKGISIEELADLILDLLGSRAEIVVEDERRRPPRSEVDRLVCDATALHELTGWQPKMTLQEGVGLTIEWLERHLAKLKPHLYNV